MALLLETTYILTTKDLQIVKRYKLFFNVKQTNLPDGLEYDSLLSTATGIATIMQRLHRYHTLTLRHSYFAHIDCVYVQEEKKLKVTSCHQDFIPLDSFLEKVPESHLISICTQLAKGVDYLHSNGFWHGALKLSNMFINSKTLTCILGLPSERAVGRGNDVKKLKSDIADLVFMINIILAMWTTGQSHDHMDLQSKFRRMSKEYHDSGAVLNHVERPRLAVVTKYQPICALYQSRRVLRSWSKVNSQSK